MPNRSWMRWSGVLGFALGGFFDGILLHQILQWHHLLSLVSGLADLRTQVLWDGYFHALMYIIAVVSLWGLWRARTTVHAQWDRDLLAALAVGFGAWHIVDSVASHWVLGIHRIRLDSPNPLLWDLTWFIAFGMVPLLIGWLLLRCRRILDRGVSGSTFAVLLAGLLTTSMAAWSLRPAPGRPFTTIAFASGVRPAQVMNAVVAANASLVWANPSMSVVVVDVPTSTKWRFYTQGALLVSGAGLPSGCFSWSEV